MFKKGQLIVLEQGEYSSFGYAGPFTVLRDFDKEPVVAEFIAATAKATDQTEGAFVAWLARAGYIADVSTEHWYLGDYGFHPLDFVEDDPEWNATVPMTFRHRAYGLTPKAQAELLAAEAARHKEQATRAAAYDALHGPGAYDRYLRATTTGLPSTAIGTDA